jgi:prolyl-tRNA synthetase
LLDFYATVIEDLLWWIGIPSVTVQTPALASYGKTTYLVVAVLPDKRPTVLATLYILSDELRVALGEQRDVIDVGFTGKLLATAAMLHVDAHGLALPATIAPVQVGVTLSADSDRVRYGRWLEGLRQAGLRCDTTLVTRAGERARAERTWHRKSVPLVIGLDRTPGSVTVCTRTPLERTELSELPEPQRIQDLLIAGDARLAKTARRVFDSAMHEGGHLRSMCRSCAETADLAVFGVVVPRTPVRCERCGVAAGQRLFISDEGRFY